MKSQYGWLKYSVFCLLYMVVTLIMLYTGESSLQHKKTNHLYQDAIHNVYHLSVYTIQSLWEKEDSIPYIRVLDAQQNTIGYVALIQDSSYFHLFKGWLAFDPKFEILNFKIDTWIDFPALKNLINSDVHAFFLKCLQMNAPFLLNQPTQNLVDNSGNHYLFTAEDINSLLLVEEKFNIVSLDLKSRYLAWGRISFPLDNLEMR